MLNCISFFIMRKIYEVYAGDEFVTYTNKKNIGRIRAKCYNKYKKVKMIERQIATPSFRTALELKSKEAKKNAKIVREVGILPSRYVLRYASTFNCSREEKRTLLYMLSEAEKWGESV